jgi:hypothetical protein
MINTEISNISKESYAAALYYDPCNYIHTTLNVLYQNKSGIYNVISSYLYYDLTVRVDQSDIKDIMIPIWQLARRRKERHQYKARTVEYSRDRDILCIRHSYGEGFIFAPDQRPIEVPC